MMIQLRSRELFAFGVCCALAGMQLITFLDRLESGSRAWISLASMLIFAAMAASVMFAVRKRRTGPAAA